MATVEAKVNQHPETRRYRIAFKHDHIEIYEQIGPNIDALFSQFQTAFLLDPGLTSRLQFEVHDAPYTPVLRFTFFDPTRRWFSTKRMCYRGSIGWLARAEANGTHN